MFAQWTAFMKLKGVYGFSPMNVLSVVHASRSVR